VSISKIHNKYIKNINNSNIKYKLLKIIIKNHKILSVLKLIFLIMKINKLKS